jgi:hypothetical protein
VCPFPLCVSSATYSLPGFFGTARFRSGKRLASGATFFRCSHEIGACSAVLMTSVIFEFVGHVQDFGEIRRA